MRRSSRMTRPLLTVGQHRLLDESESDDFPLESLLSPEEDLDQYRSELKGGLTDLQRLFLFGKLGGLNDKDAALAAGYSLSVAEPKPQIPSV